MLPGQTLASYIFLFSSPFRVSGKKLPHHATGPVIILALTLSTHSGHLRGADPCLPGVHGGQGPPAHNYQSSFSPVSDPGMFLFIPHCFHSPSFFFVPFSFQKHFGF